MAPAIAQIHHPNLDLATNGTNRSPRNILAFNILNAARARKEPVPFGPQSLGWSSSLDFERSGFSSQSGNVPTFLVLRFRRVVPTMNRAEPERLWVEGSTGSRPEKSRSPLRQQFAPKNVGQMPDRQRVQCHCC